MAACLDGTSPGFYYRPASSPSNSTKWVFWMMGGAWCYSPEDCYQRSKVRAGGRVRGSVF